MDKAELMAMLAGIGDSEEIRVLVFRDDEDGEPQPVGPASIVDVFATGLIDDTGYAYIEANLGRR